MQGGSRVERPSGNQVFSFQFNALDKHLLSFFIGEVGFLAEHRRINVAITRARRHLAVVGDSETVSHDSFLKSLIEYMSSQGDVRSAHEYIHESLATLDASNCNFESPGMFLSEISKDNKKRKGSEAKKENIKELDSKESEKKTRNDKDQINSAKTSTDTKVAELEASSSSFAGAISTESSSYTEGHANDNFQEVHQSLSSNITVSTRYSRENLEKKIVNFTQDGSKFELPFPKTLNSQQRFDVHSIAEKMGLVHESKGEGKDRYIVVSKPKPAPKG